MTERNGYQPIKTSADSVTPPNTGSNVKAKKNGYTWKEIDKSWWKGFDTCKEKMSKKLEQLEEENNRLKAQIPQWHDLRKDPNDLPKECKNVLCFVWQGEGYYCVVHIIKGGDNSARWWASNKSEQLNVIAWCEIPQFKE